MESYFSFIPPKITRYTVLLHACMQVAATYIAIPSCMKGGPQQANSGKVYVSAIKFGTYNSIGW